MFALLLRHAEAQPASESGRDEDRALTATGVRQAEFLAGWFQSAAGSRYRPAVVYVSEAERSRRTGAIIAEALNLPLREINELHPDTTPQGMIQLASQALHRKEPTLLVGHNPNLHVLLDLIAAGTPPLSTGELVVINSAAEVVTRVRAPER